MFCGLWLCLFLFATAYSRHTVSLNGLWRFRVHSENSELRWRWPQNEEDVIDMPVPSSFNDITTNTTIRDHRGWVWYQTEFQLEEKMRSSNILLHIGGAHYSTIAWVNGMEVGRHEGGHMPFEFRIEAGIRAVKGTDHVLTVAVNNTLTPHTIPQGKFTCINDTNRYPSSYWLYSHDFDYFDYSGIHGNVYLKILPEFFIEDIIVESSVQDGSAEIKYDVVLNTNLLDIRCEVEIEGPEFFMDLNSCVGVVSVNHPVLWWPRATFPDKIPGQLYSIKVTILNVSTELDSFTRKFGIRTIEWTNALYLNSKRIYFKGFGMHQDAEIRGRGFDYCQLVRDMNLLKWTSANAIRTSHYPYSEEFMELADKNGIMIILETPACSLNLFDDEILQKHKTILTEMWTAFRRHPSVVMWSLANEPRTDLPESNVYFSTLYNHTRSLDPTRPITFVTSQNIANEKAVQHMDVVSVNRYSGWYQDGGKLNLINYQVQTEMKQWRDKFKVPVLITEYGAGALSGVQTLPASMWSENYQTDLLREHFKAFDHLRAENVIIGELIWNFADFNVEQEYNRPGKCVKGVFTRNRQPKAAAFAVKERYEKLYHEANCIKNCIGKSTNEVILWD